MWYLANHLGERFLGEAERLLGPSISLGDGLWRAQVLERVVFLLSRDVLPVERDSVPLHLVSREPMDRELALAREVVGQPGFWDLYGPWLAFLHPAIWEEVQRMVRASGTEPTLDLRPLIELVGYEQAMDQLDLKRILDALGAKRIVDEFGLKRLLSEVDLRSMASQLTPEEREELIRQLKG